MPTKFELEVQAIQAMEAVPELCTLDDTEKCLFGAIKRFGHAQEYELAREENILAVLQALELLSLNFLDELLSHGFMYARIAAILVESVTCFLHDLSDTDSAYKAHSHRAEIIFIKLKEWNVRPYQHGMIIGAKKCPLCSGNL